MLNYEIFQVNNWCVYGMCSDNVECIRNLNCQMVFLFVLVRNVEQGKGGWSRLCFLFCFNCSEFGFLYVVYFVIGFVIEYDNGQYGSYIEVGSNSKGVFSKGEVMIFQYVVSVDIEDEYCVGDIIGCYSVNKFYLCYWVQYQFREVYYFYMYGFEIEICSDWVLYLVVCYQNL